MEGNLSIKHSESDQNEEVQLILALMVLLSMTGICERIMVSENRIDRCKVPGNLAKTFADGEEASCVFG
jgi:hypothetical protein